MRRLVVMCVCVALFPGLTALAAPVQWKVADGGNDHWYEAVHTSNGIDWFTAESEARARGGHLATIASSAENTFAQDLVRFDDTFWYVDGWGSQIGPWLGGYKDPVDFSTWHWVTGEPWVYTAWSPGEPNNLGGFENRVHCFNRYAGAYWNDIGGTIGTIKGYIVEWEPEAGAWRPQPVQWAAAQGGNGHWYQVVYVPGRVTWVEAERAARAAGGHLAAIGSADENAFVFGLVAYDDRLWYLNQSNDQVGPWFGGYKDTVDYAVWHWVTGEPWAFSNWYPGEPNNVGGDENRTHYFKRDTCTACWNDINLYDTTLGYVIEYEFWPPGRGARAGALPVLLLDQ